MARSSLFLFLVLISMATRAEKPWQDSPHGPMLERIIPPGFTPEMLPEPASRGARLTRRARLAGRVLGVAGVPTAIGARDGVFTQIWSVESLHAPGTRRPALAELFRVLRPGCPIALQEVVRRSPGAPALRGTWETGTLDEWRDDLAAAGFRQVEHEDVTDGRAETSPIVLSARARLDERLAAGLPPDDPWHAAAAERRRIEEIVAGPDYRVVHLFAQRPSV